MVSNAVPAQQPATLVQQPGPAAGVMAGGKSAGLGDGGEGASKTTISEETFPCNHSVSQREARPDNVPGDQSRQVSRLVEGLLRAEELIEEEGEETWESGREESACVRSEALQRMALDVPAEADWELPAAGDASDGEEEEAAATATKGQRRGRPRVMREVDARAVRTGTDDFGMRFCQAWRRWTVREDSGVPAEAVQLRDEAEFKHDAALSCSALQRDNLRDWHPARRFGESDEFVATMPDWQPMKSPKTSHVPVMWYHTAQLARAKSAGAEVPMALGPSPYGGLPSAPSRLKTCTSIDWRGTLRLSGSKQLRVKRSGYARATSFASHTYQAGGTDFVSTSRGSERNYGACSGKT
eukprot:SAG11_NODE_1976_length_3974_cov_4.102452_3_plen_355_part_00